MQERLLFATMNLIGHRVTVRVADRSVYEGIFHTATTEGGFGVVLQLAKVKTGPSGLPYGALADDPAVVTALQSHKTIVVPPAEFVSMEALGVDVSYSERQSLSESPSAESVGSATFKTDTGISGFSGRAKERDLVAWNTDEHSTTQVSLEGEKSADKPWDQFSSNQKLFGVKSTFDEEVFWPSPPFTSLTSSPFLSLAQLYTTKLDRDTHEYRRKEREAEKLASEIMKQSSGNFHRQEVRLPPPPPPPEHFTPSVLISCPSFSSFLLFFFFCRSAVMK